MCLIVWDWDPEAKNLLVLSNRDEAYRRATLPLHAWIDSTIYAGKTSRDWGHGWDAVVMEEWLPLLISGVTRCRILKRRAGVSWSQNF